MLGISDGIDTVGDIRWELLGYLVVAWVGAYLVVWKGLHNSSKVGEESIGLCASTLQLPRFRDYTRHLRSRT